MKGQGLKAAFKQHSMIVVFVLDTSVSMNQRAMGGLALLDCAKSAAEHFIKVCSGTALCRLPLAHVPQCRATVPPHAATRVLWQVRQRDPANRGDVYALVTCEEGSAAVKAFDRRAHLPGTAQPCLCRYRLHTQASRRRRHPWAGFLAALKGAAACDLTRLGLALKRSLDALHLQRLAAGTDAWGLGYQPAGMEPTLLLLLSDGTELTSLEGVAEARGPRPRPAQGASFRCRALSGCGQGVRASDSQKVQVRVGGDRVACRALCSAGAGAAAGAHAGLGAGGVAVPVGPAPVCGAAAHAGTGHCRRAGLLARIQRRRCRRRRGACRREHSRCIVRGAKADAGSGTVRGTHGAALSPRGCVLNVRGALVCNRLGAAQVMGGRCYAVGSLRALLACVEGLAQRLAPALVASFRALPCADAPQLAQLPDATVAARAPRVLPVATAGAD